MVLVRPVTRTKISTTEFGHPVSDFIAYWTPTPWVNVTFQNGWANYPGYTPTQYRKVGDMVYIRGTLAGSGTPGANAFNLPAGFRPPTLVELPCVGNTASGRAIVDCIIEFTGNVRFDPGPLIATGLSAMFSITP